MKFLRVFYFTAMFNSLSSDGYQIVVGGNQAKAISDMTIANIQVKITFSDIAHSIIFI